MKMKKWNWYLIALVIAYSAFLVKVAHIIWGTV